MLYLLTAAGTTGTLDIIQDLNGKQAMQHRLGGSCVQKFLALKTSACAGLTASMGQMVLLAFVPDKRSAFGICAIGALGGVSFPAISSIKANNVAEHEQVRQQCPFLLSIPTWCSGNWLRCICSGLDACQSADRNCSDVEPDPQPLKGRSANLAMLLSFSLGLLYTIPQDRVGSDFYILLAAQQECAWAPCCGKLLHWWLQ